MAKIGHIDDVIAAAQGSQRTLRAEDCPVDKTADAWESRELRRIAGEQVTDDEEEEDDEEDDEESEDGSSASDGSSEGGRSDLSPPPASENGGDNE